LKTVVIVAFTVPYKCTYLLTYLFTYSTVDNCQNTAQQEVRTYQIVSE